MMIFALLSTSLQTLHDMQPQCGLPPIMANAVANRLTDQGQGRAPDLPRRPPGVSRYRIVMAVVFCCIVLIDRWSDRNLSAHWSDVVGSISIVIWALTLLGALGVGPMRLFSDEAHR